VVARLAPGPDTQAERAPAATETQHGQVVEAEQRPVVSSGPLSAAVTPAPAPIPAPAPPPVEKQEEPAVQPVRPQAPAEKAAAEKPAADKPAEKPAAKPQPPHPKKKPAELVLERWASKRLCNLTDEELRKQLLLPAE